MLLFKVDSIADIIYTLVPLAVFTFIIIVIFYKPVQPDESDNEDEHDETNQTIPITDSVSFDKRLIDNHYSLHRRSLISVESDPDRIRRSSKISQTQQQALTKPAAIMTSFYNDNHRFNKNPNFESTQNETNLKKEFLAEVRRKSADKAAHENHFVVQENIDSNKLAEFYI